MIDFTNKLLVVVDMEDGFWSDMTAGVVETVELLIQQARREEADILFLEFIGMGLIDRMLAAVRGYDGFGKRLKPIGDGCPQVLEFCTKLEIEPAGFVFCGVSTHCCVAKTAASVARKKPRSLVEVVMQGCGCYGGNKWDEFPQAKNIRLVSVPEAVAAA